MQYYKGEEKMRSAKEQEYFPYDLKTTCYILVKNNGDVSQVAHNNSELKAAYDLVINGEAVLYAVWPGTYRSDLFIIDDINSFADAVGIYRKDSHIHDVEWKISDLDDGVSRYAWVDCKFKCGCSFRKIGIRKFANDMREQKGWVVATSTGYGCHGDEFTISVSRASLKRK